MFEIIYHIYIEQQEEENFYSWLAKLEVNKVNADLPEGISLLSIGKMIHSDFNIIVTKMHVADGPAFERMRQASKVPGFIQDLEVRTSRARVVESTLVKKIL